VRRYRAVDCVDHTANLRVVCLRSAVSRAFEETQHAFKFSNGLLARTSGAKCLRRIAARESRVRRTDAGSNKREERPLLVIRGDGRGECALAVGACEFRATPRAIAAEA
jgi:hypothetical protein